MEVKNKKISILGVNVDNMTKSEILEKVDSFFVDNKFHQIATVGPEFILEAQKNDKFKSILNSCDLNVADGFGMKLAFWRFGKKLKCRFAGVDLMHEILRMANEKELSVFLACRKDGLSSYEEVKSAILKIYPNLKVDGANIDINDNLYMIHNTSYMIHFCNFGAPYQEMFINKLKCDKISVAMGVGGSFDFLTGKIRRAPKLLRNLGLEWFWRLIQQPNRWKRIWNAVIIFPIKVIFRK